MRTLVYQSFRTGDIPLWIHTCMDSVRAWCVLRDFSYECIDDSFFSYAPVDFRKRVRGQRHLMADIARLGEPIHAANLCLTFRNTFQYGLQLTDSVFESVIDSLRAHAVAQGRQGAV